jgi:hypothetical protein
MGPRIFLLCWLPSCFGLTPLLPSSTSTSTIAMASSKRLHTSNRFLALGKAKSTPTRVYGGNRFDITKPTFDLLSLRLIRSDALLRYNSLNQSEPLRINLFLLATMTLLGYPLWCESVTGDVATSVSTVASSVSGLGCAALFWRERTRRYSQLSRMEKELKAEDLEVRMPVNAAISSSRTMARLRDLKGTRRILAIRGSREALSGILLNTLCLLRRRLVQSQTLVVLVPTDGSQRLDWGWDSNRLGGNSLWLADALNVDGTGGWLSYFDNLLDKGDGVGGGSSDEVAWFALNFKGRSIASGYGDAPRVLELLGQQLQPVGLLDKTDKAELEEGTPAVKQILERQLKFYSALTDSCDENVMRSVFSTNTAADVDEVVNGGGRIDGWDKCLEPGARPSGMVVSGSDVWVASDTVAYSTCIEFPTNAGIDGATLLAVQRWGREGDDGDWRLELHHTIPWSAGSRAGGTLRCDCRGCVALSRSPDKRTFGGLIG